MAQTTDPTSISVGALSSAAGPFLIPLIAASLEPSHLSHAASYIASEVRGMVETPFRSIWNARMDERKLKYFLILVTLRQLQANYMKITAAVKRLTTLVGTNADSSSDVQNPASNHKQKAPNLPIWLERLVYLLALEPLLYCALHAVTRRRLLTEKYRNVLDKTMYPHIIKYKEITDCVSQLHPHDPSCTHSLLTESRSVFSKVSQIYFRVYLSQTVLAYALRIAYHLFVRPFVTVPPPSLRRNRSLQTRHRSVSAGSLARSVTFGEASDKTSGVFSPSEQISSPGIPLKRPGISVASAPAELTNPRLASPPTYTSAGPPILYEDQGSAMQTAPSSAAAVTPSSASIVVSAAASTSSSVHVSFPQSGASSQSQSTTPPSLTVSLPDSPAFTPRTPLRRSATSHSRRTSLLVASPHGAERRSSVLLVLADSVTEDVPRHPRLVKSASTSGLGRVVGQAWGRIRRATGSGTIGEQELEESKVETLERWSGSDMSGGEDYSDSDTDSEGTDSLLDELESFEEDEVESPRSDLSFSDASSRLASAAASASGSLPTSPSAGPSESEIPLRYSSDTGSHGGEEPRLSESIYDSGDEEASRAPSVKVAPGTEESVISHEKEIRMMGEYVVPLAGGELEESTRGLSTIPEDDIHETSPPGTVTPVTTQSSLLRSSTAPPAAPSSPLYSDNRTHFRAHARSVSATITGSSTRPSSRFSSAVLSYPRTSSRPSTPTSDVYKLDDSATAASGWLSRLRSGGVSSALEELETWSKEATKEVVNQVAKDAQGIADGWAHSTAYFGSNLIGHRFGMCYVLRLFGPIPSHPVLYYFSSMLGGWAIVFEHDHRVRSVNRMILAYLLCETLPDVGPFARTLMEATFTILGGLSHLSDLFTDSLIGVDVRSAISSLPLFAQSSQVLEKVREFVSSDQRLGGAFLLGSSAAFVGTLMHSGLMDLKAVFSSALSASQM
ncbi:hypothetical protein M427DRAFT_131230 [Gonapodya prolifera JEL478]|uniref:Uncharacterized protein n=1 Tax=Gonapodya prolifera (strain JEL478) TaxID=1344416 RepID=A0A139AUK5_GONPJ|nr:hypothetical protein M427DRAFT_131230 [Gonapodya prolifera JEL478]|eukprot:KXS20384.1 hypothetical protein M427DRAFT_131230 [Gonapodya prolifera JEL478]